MTLACHGAVVLPRCQPRDSTTDRCPGIASRTAKQRQRHHHPISTAAAGPLHHAAPHTSPVPPQLQRPACLWYNASRGLVISSSHRSLATGTVDCPATGHLQAGLQAEAWQSKPRSCLLASSQTTCLTADSNSRSASGGGSRLSSSNGGGGGGGVDTLCSSSSNTTTTSSSSSSSTDQHALTLLTSQLPCSAAVVANAGPVVDAAPHLITRALVPAALPLLPSAGRQHEPRWQPQEGQQQQQQHDHQQDPQQGLQHAQAAASVALGGPQQQATAATAAAGAPGAEAVHDLEQPPESGLVPDVDLARLVPPAKTSTPGSGQGGKLRMPPEPRPAAVAVAAPGSMAPPAGRTDIRSSWARLMRWSRQLRHKELQGGVAAREKVDKVVVFGGGSFGTAMGVALARQKPELQVTLLLRDPYLCKDINQMHCNTRYLKEYELPHNINATTSAVEAIAGAQYAIHAVPVQGSRSFLQGIKDLLPSALPIISVSKGIELSSGQLMSDLIPSVLGRKQPVVYLSGPSFAKEVMDNKPTGVVAASKDRALARQVQGLFASPSMRVNLTDDVVGVEVCGALKNVLAIAAGIVEGLELGHNAMAALVSQGCAEIRWLAEKMHAKPTTISGLSGLGDIMLTCYGSLSRNRTVGVRLGKGEKLEDILSSSSQVAEGVPTAGVVVTLARKYRVQLPVLTAVAQVLEGHLSPREAVFEIMNLPQIEER